MPEGNGSELSIPELIPEFESDNVESNNEVAAVVEEYDDSDDSDDEGDREVLQEQVLMFQEQVTTFQEQVTTFQETFQTLQEQVKTLQEQVKTLQEEGQKKDVVVVKDPSSAKEIVDNQELDSENDANEDFSDQDEDNVAYAMIDLQSAVDMCAFAVPIRARELLAACSAVRSGLTQNAPLRAINCMHVVIDNVKQYNSILKDPSNTVRQYVLDMNRALQRISDRQVLFNY